MWLLFQIRSKYECMKFHKMFHAIIIWKWVFTTIQFDAHNVSNVSRNCGLLWFISIAVHFNLNHQFNGGFASFATWCYIEKELFYSVIKQEKEFIYFVKSQLKNLDRKKHIDLFYRMKKCRAFSKCGFFL